MQDVVGPQSQFGIAPGFGKSNALLGQAPSQAGAAHLGLHVQQAQLRLGVRDLDHKRRTHHSALTLGDPGVFFFRVKFFHKLRGDLGHQGLEGAIPAVFLGIQHALPMRHPANVTHLQAAQNNVWRHALSPLS
jgi:hypothetical protein